MLWRWARIGGEECLDSFRDVGSTEISGETKSAIDGSVALLGIIIAHDNQAKVALGAGLVINKVRQVADGHWLPLHKRHRQLTVISSIERHQESFMQRGREWSRHQAIIIKYGS